MLDFDFEQLASWINQNPDWAYLVVFTIAFIESLAVIGLLMPGWLLLLGVGVLIGTGSISFYMTSFMCFLGAVFGEYLSFRIGTHFKHNVYQWTVFKNNPQWLENSETFFQKYGTASIALGRFIGPVRAFVPLLAGMSSMRTLHFQITNVLSALVWAPLYLIPGILVGSAISIEPVTRWVILINLLIVVLSGWFLLSHPGLENTSVKMRKIILILVSALFFGAVIYLLQGPEHQYFFQLLDKIYIIISK